ncbi:MAG: biotin transporter BioY [Armatimonadota bacterium]|nr:MAG: biotin transporter BioY [Armatimonadota bacterium]
MLARILARREAESRAGHLARCLILSALGAALTAIGSRIAIPLWPVPVTLQVFFVLLCGAALGRKWAAAAQAQYLAAGLCGLPVFAGGGAGPAALLGPTGGYLVGFVAAAYVTGWLTEVLASRRAGRCVATLAGAAVIWLCGWAWLAVWALAGSEAAPLRAAFAWGVAPFVALDAVKAVAAAGAGRLLGGVVGERT